MKKSNFSNIYKNTNFTMAGHLKAQALDMDKANWRPCVVRQYRYILEKPPIKSFLMAFVPMGIGCAVLAYLIKEGYWESIPLFIICLLFGVAPFFVLGILGAAFIKGDIKEHRWFVQRLKEAQKANEKYPGEIISYRIKPTILTKKGKAEYVDRITYILKAQANVKGKQVVFDTPELEDCPMSVLRSTKCMVYKFNRDFYALDFDLRTKKTDETASIPKRYV